MHVCDFVDVNPLATYAKGELTSHQENRSMHKYHPYACMHIYISYQYFIFL
jgi:hypothetical protein